MAKSIFSIFAGVLLGINSHAQSIMDCTSLKQNTTKCAAVVSAALRIDMRELKYRNVPVEICSLDGSFIIHFGRSEYYRKAGFQLSCDNVSQGEAFNNKRNGLKQGVWFYSLLGRVKRAAEYDSGRVVGNIITFWPDGYPKHIERYNPSGRLVLGSSESYKRNALKNTK
jgi:antitoxin component YwqK of YwqJK toxin-antitoxin module